MGIEAAAESLHSAESDPKDFARLIVQHERPGITEQAFDLVCLAGFAIVVTQYPDNGTLAVGQFLCDQSGFTWQATIGEIPAEDEDVRVLLDVREQRSKGCYRRLVNVDVSDRRDPNTCFLPGHAPLPPDVTVPD